MARITAHVLLQCVLHTKRKGLAGGRCRDDNFVCQCGGRADWTLNNAVPLNWVREDEKVMACLAATSRKIHVVFVLYSRLFQDKCSFTVSTGSHNVMPLEKNMVHGARSVKLFWLTTR